jgi:hypothetical protein
MPATDNSAGQVQEVQRGELINQLASNYDSFSNPYFWG